jgi:hypothetical protein
MPKTIQSKIVQQARKSKNGGYFSGIKLGLAKVFDFLFF